MEQRIYFQNGKLVVETDNGRIKEGNTTTQISGYFIASADTVAMILAELEGQLLTMEHVPCWPWGTRATNHWSLIAEKEVVEELKEVIKARDKANSELTIMTRKANMLKDVLDRINEHNKRWWRFWERKIDISDMVELYGTRLLED